MFAIFYSSSFLYRLLSSLHSFSFCSSLHSFSLCSSLHSSSLDSSSLSFSFLFFFVSYLYCISLLFPYLVVALDLHHLDLVPVEEEVLELELELA